MGDTFLIVGLTGFFGGRQM